MCQSTRGTGHRSGTDESFRPAQEKGCPFVSILADGISGKVGLDLPLDLWYYGNVIHSDASRFVVRKPI